MNAHVNAHSQRLFTALLLAGAAHITLGLLFWSAAGADSGQALLRITRAVGAASPDHAAPTRAAQSQSGDDRRSQRATGGTTGVDRHTDSGPGSAATAITRFVVVARRPVADSGQTSQATRDRPSRPAKPQPAQRRSASRDARAAYLAQWQDRIETLGNRQRPSALFNTSTPRRLTLAVRLDAEGRLRALRVMQSSGAAALDAAAMKLVRSAAPFPHFGPRLARRAHELNFAYDWVFKPGQPRRFKLDPRH